jgi:nitroreductase
VHPGRPLRTTDTMETSESILSRRSIRRGFSPRQIPAKAIDLIVRCALSAPSSKDAQPWRIHVVTSRAFLSEIASAMVSSREVLPYTPIDPATGEPRPEYESTVRESAEILRDVPLALFVENDGSFSGGRGALAAHPAALKEALVGYSFELVSLGAAIQSMWLAAHDLGLAGVFIGDVLVVEQKIQRSLSVVGDLVGVLALGFSSSPAHVNKLIQPGRVVFHD